MANIWYLKIKVVDAQDAEKMKNYVRELNKEYTLMPTSDIPMTNGIMQVWSMATTSCTTPMV